MKHPFELDISDLEHLDNLKEVTPEDNPQVTGGTAQATTMAVGEEGGYMQPPRQFPLPFPVPKPPVDAKGFTSAALGEEGGDLDWSTFI